MFTTDGRPGGEKVAGSTATLYRILSSCTVRPVMASVPSLPGWLCLLPDCLATSAQDHSEASLEAVWLVEHLKRIPDSSHYMFAAKRSTLTPLMNRFHIALWRSWSLEGVGLFLGGIRRGVSVAPLHSSLLLAGAPTSAELPVVRLSSCAKNLCPPPCLWELAHLLALLRLIL